MATAQISDKQRVLKFTSAWEGQFQPSDYSAKSMNNAVGEARLIVNAKKGADNWMSRLLLVMLSTADEEQRTLWEVTLATQAAGQVINQVEIAGDDAARQALAI